ncbi:protein of unknown function [Taphrina deformans PYCC 5710]|uniref:Uncharacterized protein n=1 Tax=Taphrina deformans (strain PYCC 5710 / ATCC 11124 / CBS 356.35 / IMI 108563 / JCM 9778 / NBRC 8474) TaxID=1097556 RepID=R4XEW9_TAPDE|nr:protein of unknown function [Taphrina deformans PYCC 5710]|eukprot:CCG83021.1 protein of unknown function [Taphrina deformans PYCC 5710]
MSSTSSTTRRKLDFGRKRGPTLASAAAASRSLSASSSSSFTDVHEIDEPRSQQELQDSAHATDIRNMVAAGPPETNQVEYAAIVRDTLYKKAEEQLKTDEWIFSGVTLEKEQ